MTNILLISEDKIKTESALNDNVYGKFILPAIVRSQDIDLCMILGENLLNEVYSRVTGNSITGDYKTLLEDYIQPYLLKRVIVNIIPYLAVKLANIGEVITNDEHVVSLSQKEVDLLQSNYSYESNWYARRLQEYLLANKDTFGLEPCTCDKIKANLDSAADCPIWLGGYRSRIIREGC
jgi:hypothetical protein